MKSDLAKARDKWLESEEGKKCCEGRPSGQYLQNRWERAFVAGWDACGKALKEHGLFACPLNNGEWMVGSANHIYSVNIQDDHYKDPLISIAPTLTEAIQKWRKDNNVDR